MRWLMWLVCVSVALTIVFLVAETDTARALMVLSWVITCWFAIGWWLASALHALRSR